MNYEYRLSDASITRAPLETPSFVLLSGDPRGATGLLADRFWLYGLATIVTGASCFRIMLPLARD